MLKIKDNVDLKEVEKILLNNGFNKVEDVYGNERMG